MTHHRISMVSRVLGLSLLAAALSASVASAAVPTFAGRTFTVALTGAAEEPHDGDPDATGTAVITVNLGQGTFCYQLTVSGLDPVIGAHLHVITNPDRTGPVAIPLASPTTGQSSGCIQVDRALLLEILRNPEQYYVNVHTTTFPAGAIRGDLFPGA